jgi:hypothetical protein
MALLTKRSQTIMRPTAIFLLAAIFNFNKYKHALERFLFSSFLLPRSIDELNLVFTYIHILNAFDSEFIVCFQTEEKNIIISILRLISCFMLINALQRIMNPDWIYNFFSFFFSKCRTLTLL